MLLLMWEGTVAALVKIRGGTSGDIYIEPVRELVHAPRRG